jgi:pyruvate/2-oxoglutarate dehydrogenase complex dihydrolipoamide dehydrogenase (E3) component
MFTHVANEEAAVAWHNSTHEQRAAMDYRAIPHAVFGHPQIAAVGLTEEQARREHDILVGKVPYTKAPKGEAMMETDGFAKAIVDGKSGRILGFHIIGPYAPILIQEVINAMATGGGTNSIDAGLHIHPALPELVTRTLRSLRTPD